MLVTGKCIYKSANSGVSSKTEKPYWILKFLDDDAEEFFTFFVSQELFQLCSSIRKDTPVCLTVDLKVSTRFVKLIDVQMATD